MTPEEYEALVAEQNEGCWICSKRGKLHVDHDHESGLVRGLLCHKCNVAVGMMEDDPFRLEKAATYLRKTSCQLV